MITSALLKFLVKVCLPCASLCLNSGRMAISTENVVIATHIDNSNVDSNVSMLEMVIEQIDSATRGFVIFSNTCKPRTACVVRSMPTNFTSY